MAPLVAAGLALFELVPGLLKIFGKERPAAVVEQVGELAKVITGTTGIEEAQKAIASDPTLAQKFIEASDIRAKDWARMYIEDVKDARDRDVKLAQAGVSNHRANWLVASALLLVVVCLIVVVWMSDLHEFAKGAVTLILGRALGWVEQIFSFEFGTTRTSKTKDGVIDTLTSNGKL